MAKVNDEAIQERVDLGVRSGATPGSAGLAYEANPRQGQLAREIIQTLIDHKEHDQRFVQLLNAQVTTRSGF